MCEDLGLRVRKRGAEVREHLRYVNRRRGNVQGASDEDEIKSEQDGVYADGEGGGWGCYPAAQRAASDSCAPAADGCGDPGARGLVREHRCRLRCGRET